jgi:hypothetical protein
MAGTMDQLRVRAFLDAINGTSSLPAPGTGPATRTAWARWTRFWPGRWPPPRPAIPAAPGA